MRPQVLCVGVLVADVFVPPLEQLPTAGELVATDDFLVQPGGCAANVAIGLGTLGVRAGVCGRVGDDLFGEFVERDLRLRGIDTSGVLSSPGLGTSKTVILPVAGEDRRYIHTFGANAALTAADVDEAALEAAEVVYVGGYLILPGLREVELGPRLQEARARGTTVVLDDGQAPAGREPSLEAVGMLLPLADYFVPNVDEARVLTGETEPSRQADRLVEHGARNVLIKLGERGTYVRSGGRSFEVEAPRVSVVEPSGAGDAFAAGLIVGILEGWDLERTVRFASVTGASAARRSAPGAASSPEVRPRRFSRRTHSPPRRCRSDAAVRSLSRAAPRKRPRQAAMRSATSRRGTATLLEAVVEAAEARAVARRVLGLRLRCSWISPGSTPAASRLFGCLGRQRRGAHRRSPCPYS